MKKYDIYALFRRAGKAHGSYVMPPLETRLSTEQDYLKTLRAMLRGIAQEVQAGVIPTYAPIRMTKDADESTFRRLRAVAEMLVNIARGTVNRILQLEAHRHTERFADQFRKTVGIDISAVVTQEGLEEYLRNAANRNAALIKSLADETVKRVEQATLQNQINGNSVASLRKQLTEEFGVSEKRAKIIARDQSAKLTSDLNRIRQEQAGIEEYRWSTVKDERVRELHQRLDGKTYKWGQPTGAESGLPPGQPIMCRCIARAIVKW